MKQEGRPLVDQEVDAFPIVFRLGEHDGLAAQRPRIGHPCDIQVGVALDGGILLRPYQILHAIDHFGGGVECEGINRSDDLPLLHPVVGGRVVIGVLQHEYAVRRQAGRFEIRRCACEVDVPRAVDAMQLGSPDVDARRTGFVLMPHHRLGGLLQIVDA